MWLHDFIGMARQAWHWTNNNYQRGNNDTLVERGATDTAPIRLLEVKAAACEGAVCLLRMTQHESVPHWSLVLPFASPCYRQGVVNVIAFHTFWLRLSVLLTDASLGPKRLGSEVLFTTAKWCHQLHSPHYGRASLWSLSIYYSHHLKISQVSQVMALWQLDAWLITVITSLPLMLRCLKWLCFVAGKAVCQQDSLLKPQLSRAAVAVPAGFHSRWVVVHQDWCAYAGFQGTGTVESETVSQNPRMTIYDVPSYMFVKKDHEKIPKAANQMPIGHFLVEDWPRFVDLKGKQETPSNK